MSGTATYTPQTEHGARRLGRRAAAVVATLLLVVLTSQVGFLPQPASAAPGQRVDLRVLVVDDGDSQVEAIASQLTTEGVPFTRLVLGPGRPTITDSFLFSGSRAYFQAVVLPTERPADLTDAEMTTLANYERTFGIRQVNGFSWAHPGVGLNHAENPGYIGSLDGMTANVTAAGLSGPFSYLKGPVPFESGSFGFLATPRDASFQPLVTAPIPGSSASGSVVGVYSHDGREELIITTNYNYSQYHTRLLAHGIITWATRGVHLGYNRNYFSVHIDDVLLPDSRWSTEGNCTPFDDCPRNPDGSEIYTTPDIRMTAADEAYLRQWQQTNNFKLDVVYNAAGSDEAIAANGSDPLTTALVANRNQYRWINHTYSHPYLGCVQDFSVKPWRCLTIDGQVQYASQAQITNEINQNLAWATAKGITLNRSELVTGEHSGLKTSPQQPVDNPNLAPALNATGITKIASDNSREPAQRMIGGARTVPRHPMNIFYNVGTEAEEVDEYNWIYTSVADGGSGICTANPETSTCIRPLDPATGYDSYIVPTETKIALQHVLTNDPRPHYAHQSNLAEGRILYAPVTKVLQSYRAGFATTAPIVQPTMTEASEAMRRTAVWSSIQADPTRIEAYTLDGKVYIKSRTGTVKVPITVPEGTKVSTTDGALYGAGYGGERSGWTDVGTTGTVLALPASAPAPK